LCIGEEDDGVGVFEVEEEDEEHHQTVHCEYSDCQSKAWGSTPSKVCHNLDCQTANNNKPLYLCGLCDEKLHQGDKSSHVRFNVDPTRTQGQRYNSDDFSELDSGLSTPDGSGSLTTPFCVKTVAQSLKEELQRKKQTRRHNTDDPGKEWFTLKISNNSPPEVIPALKGKSLRDALQPAFERHGLSLDDVDVYLRSSKTPLGHDYDTYYLGGQHVRIEAKGVVSPDGDVGRKRRSFSSILSRARPFSRKSKVDHHHRINEVTSYITCNYCKDK
jgi:pleckstrin domain-containing family G protein 5